MAIFLSTSDRKIATAKIAAPETRITSTQKSAPISSNDPSQLQATENKNLPDNVIDDRESDQLAAEASPSVEKAIVTEPAVSQLSDAKASQPPAEILDTVQFNLDSSKLSLMTPAEIEAILTAAKRCPSQIKLTGHTCNLGSAPANKALGLTRANRVKKTAFQ